jgi:membrane-bound lytic murein transglycosylase D
MSNRPLDRGSRSPYVYSLLAVIMSVAGCQSMQPASQSAAAGHAAPAAARPAAGVQPRPEPRPRPQIVLEPLPELPADVLSRLRDDFVLPAPGNASVQREIAWYAKNQEYLERVFLRGGRYLFHIAEELERRGMPADLALLPIVESAFDPFAYSHGRASGLWQIIPGTGRRLGLKQNWWFDARRDVLESTRAALDYLQMLHAQFNGDWLLAVAGYNSGEGNVARALKRAAAAGEPQDFWGIRRYLPAETRIYVPRLIAIRELVANPQAHGIALPELPNEAFFAAVDTGSQIDMALAADLVGIELDRLYELNPGVNRWATDPEGPHRLLVPVAHAEPFASALAQLGERERVQWTRHEIRQGESLGQIANKYHTTAAVLREINGLRGNLIRAGAHLMIPHATASLNSYSQSAGVRAERQASRARSGERRAHVVQSGESLWVISQRYRVNVRELAAWNAMAPGDVLGVGRELVIWTPVSAGASAAGATVTPVVATGPAQDQIRRVNYVVRRGDSLHSIAGRFRVTVAKLLEWNSLSAQKYLQPGQRLVMYIDVAEQSS